MTACNTMNVDLANIDMVIGMTPNQSMKRTHLPVTSFACAKESPVTVRRLSKR